MVVNLSSLGSSSGMCLAGGSSAIKRTRFLGRGNTSRHIDVKCSPQQRRISLRRPLTKAQIRNQQGNGKVQEQHIEVTVQSLALCPPISQGSRSPKERVTVETR